MKNQILGKKQAQHVVKIVTHHELREQVAELWAKEKVITLGWGLVGDIRNKSADEITKIIGSIKKADYNKGSLRRLLQFRDEIKKGDIVLAYKGKNRVALVGEVIGNYKYNTKNELGNPDGEIRHPHQRGVKWWSKPRDFPRFYLPKELSKWVAIKGTISFLNKPYDIDRLRKELETIADKVEPILEIENEEEIKDYISHHAGEIESGLTIVKREYDTDTGVADFLARDAHGKDCIIEVKVSARDSVIGQIMGYMNSHRKKAPNSLRGIIVAQEFSERCKSAAAENPNLSLYQCKKSFHFNRISG